MRLSLLAVMMSSAALMAQFKPEIAGIEIGTRTLRAGDSTYLTVKFVNRGTEPSVDEYMAFVHLEGVEKKCDDIRGHHDHPLVDCPTTTWMPNEIVTDGPYSVSVRRDTPPGKYLIHIGVYDMATGKRWLDSYAGGEITIDPNAPEVVNKAPEPLAADVAAARKAKLDARLDGAPYVIETEAYRFRLSADGRYYDLLDKRGGALWYSNVAGPAFGYASYKEDGKSKRTELVPFDRIVKNETANSLTLEKKINDDLQVAIVIEPATGPEGLRFSMKNTGKLADTCGVQILNRSFPTSNNDNGATVVGYRTGERFDTNRSLRPIRRSWGTTYSWDSTMAMMGQEKDGCALLVNWTHPHTAYDFNAIWTYAEAMPGTVVQMVSVRLDPGATECFVRPLGKGSFVQIAKAYREVAMNLGLVKTWKMKEAESGPTVRNMAGAADFKPFVFNRSVPSSRYNHSGKVESYVGYTLDEVSQIAEHLHNDLGIDKAMMVLAGWVHGGYDNQHPDPLPVAPELGGNEELVKASKRIRDTGFLFGLHDNYQDMYKDAPSWNPDYIAKNRDGSLVQGGNWAGGPCWIVCAEKQVELASRKETNLPKIEELFHPTIYFIDTIFASGLYSCFDPKHPETRADDMKYKTKLCQLARKHFGLFGSEEGREWAVPYADYMEGVFGHRVNIRNKTSQFHSHLGGDLVPLFEMVYGDCVNLYTHQSDRAVPGRDDYILACIANAEVPLYNFDNHLYFKKTAATVAPIILEKVDVKPLGDRKFNITYKWRFTEDYDKNLNMFVHFIHEKGEKEREGIAFQDDHPLVTQPMKAGEVIMDERVVNVPNGFDSNILWRVGVFDKKTLARQNVKTFTGKTHTIHLLGVLSVDEKQTVVFKPGEALGSDLSRMDNGWGEEHQLNRTDAFIKNTYEVTSWVARLAADSPMTRYIAMNDDIEYAEFGDIRIWTSHGDEPMSFINDTFSEAFGGHVTLTKHDFIVISPTFAAVHARKIENGSRVPDSPFLFTFRSLDGKPLDASKRIRVFHGFGQSKIYFYGSDIDVRSEAIIER